MTQTAVKAALIWHNPNHLYLEANQRISTGDYSQRSTPLRCHHWEDTTSNGPLPHLWRYLGEGLLWRSEQAGSCEWRSSFISPQHHPKGIQGHNRIQYEYVNTLFWVCSHITEIAPKQTTLLAWGAEPHSRCILHCCDLPWDLMVKGGW